MGFNATLEVKTGVDLKIEGLIGNATSLPFNKTVPANERMISANIVGEGKPTVGNCAMPIHNQLMHYILRN